MFRHASISPTAHDYWVFEYIFTGCRGRLLSRPSQVGVTCHVWVDHVFSDHTAVLAQGVYARGTIVFFKKTLLTDYLIDPLRTLSKLPNISDLTINRLLKGLLGELTTLLPNYAGGMASSVCIIVCFTILIVVHLGRSIVRLVYFC